MSLFSEAQWTELIQHIRNTHHWEVVLIGLPALLVLAAGVVALWLLHRDFARLIEVLR